MKNSFEEIHDLIEADYKCSEWAKNCDFKKRMKEFLDEVKEVEVELKNDDLTKLKDEMGDVLWDLIYAIYTGEKEGLFKSEEIFSGVIEKIKRRKPWALEGREVSKEEELKVWKEVKVKEKNGEYDLLR